MARTPHPLYGPEWNQSTICEWCGADGKCFTRYIPGVDIKEASMAKDIPYKNRLCAKCYGPIAPTWSYGGFNPIFVAEYAKERVESELFQYYDSFHIYELVNPRESREWMEARPWAWALTVNGNYEDIREVHIRCSLKDGGAVAREITLESIIALARKTWEADKGSYRDPIWRRALENLGFIDK